MVSFQVSGQPALRFKVAARAGAVCRQPPRAGGAAGLPCAGRAVPPPRVRVLRGLRDRRRCGVPGGAGPLSVRPRRGVRRLRVRQTRTALPGRGAVRLGGGARGHPAPCGAGAAHPVAGQAQLAGGAVSRAACRPAVGAGLAACVSLGALPPQADFRGGLTAACRSGVLSVRAAPADLFATVDGYWVVPHTFRDGLCDDEYRGSRAEHPLPADRQGHADAQPGARRPARSPSGPPLRISEAAHSPRPRVVVCGRMPAVAPGRAPRLEVTGYGLCRDR